MAEELVEKVRYEADITDLKAKLGEIARKQDTLASDTERHTGRVNKAWGGVKNFLSTGSMWFAGIAAGAAVAIPKIVDQGGKLEALDKKAKVVFTGQSLTGVQNWAKTVAGSFGVTTSEAVAMATSMGDLFKPMGFTADQAAKMSTELGDLSGALSAWTGGQRSASEVSEIITKAMLGERDGLKELGISISEADVQARLAANGQDKLTGTALEQAKALATQQLIMEKSTDAQKAWSDGSMDSIKSQNQSKASMAQLGETLTRTIYPLLQKLIPIVTKVAEWLGERLPGALKTAGRILSSVFEGGKKLITDLASAFGVSEGTIKTVLAVIAAGLVAVAIAWNAGPGLIVTAIVALVAAFLWAYNNVDWFRKGVQVAFLIVKTVISTVIEVFKVIITAVVTAAKWVGEKVGEIVGFVTGIPGRIAATVSTLWEGLKTGITIAKNWVKDRIDDVVDFVRKIPRRIGEFASGLFDGIKNAAKTAFNAVAGIWNNTVGKLSFSIPDWVPLIGGKKFDVPDIPTFHRGGITNFGTAGEGLALLRNNEAVIPLDNQGDARRVAGQAGLGGGVVIQQLNLTTTETPRRWYDESLWRVA